MTYFSDLAVLVKEEIAGVSDQVLGEILKTCHAEDEFKEAAGKTGEDATKGFSLDSDSEEEEALGIDVDLYCLDEKAAAVAALGVICMHAPTTC